MCWLQVSSLGQRSLRDLISGLEWPGYTDRGSAAQVSFKVFIGYGAQMQKTGGMPPVLTPLFEELRYHKGVGPARERMLARLNLRRRVDALFHLPHSVVQRRRIPDLL